MDRTPLGTLPYYARETSPVARTTVVVVVVVVVVAEFALQTRRRVAEFRHVAHPCERFERLKRKILNICSGVQRLRILIETSRVVLRTIEHNENPLVASWMTTSLCDEEARATAATFENRTWRDESRTRFISSPPVCQRLNSATPKNLSERILELFGEIRRVRVESSAAEDDDRNKAEIYQIDAGATSGNEGKPVWSVRVTGLVSAPEKRQKKRQWRQGDHRRE
ncbi:hypothetical protein K0M31_006341 [Melipona bicolor]|uniref:Uncharacterized protein n=1 Tax=Melipona bicolor TaxID=60889 RepID=A0AA40KLP7_9HYME|nr:hypothetical protein K0M31_006341 [Melipona bicolor]